MRILTKTQINCVKSPRSQTTFWWTRLTADINSGQGRGRLFILGVEVGRMGVLVESYISITWKLFQNVHIHSLPLPPLDRGVNLPNQS